jgi:antitoxin ParD1/3/4
MNVSLTPPLREYVRSKVKSGQYESASEVIRESLRALQERERVAATFWENVQSRLAEARDDLANGRVVDGEEAMEQFVAETEPAPRRSRKPRR